MLKAHFMTVRSINTYLSTHSQGQMYGLFWVRLKVRSIPKCRHCEERSDEATQGLRRKQAN